MPCFREGAEVDYRRSTGDFAFATVNRIRKDVEQVYYELRFDVADQQRRVTVREDTLLLMQEPNQFEECDVEDDTQRSRTTSTVVPNCKSRWCDDDRPEGALKKGMQMFYKRQNGDEVTALVSSIGCRDGGLPRVIIEFAGLDDDDQPQHMRKTVARDELWRLHHPRNLPPKRPEIGKSVRPTTFSHDSCDVDMSIPLFQTMLHAASRGGNVSLVRKLLDLRSDPQAQDFKGDSPFHYAAWYGHEEVLKLLLKCIPEQVDVGDLKNKNNGSSALDEARLQVKQYPGNERRLGVFALLFGRAPSAQEKAGRVHAEDEDNSWQISTYRKNYAVLAQDCPFLGDRNKEFDFESPDAIKKMADGILEEERNLLAGHDLHYNDWSYWRASFCRGARRFGHESNLIQRMDASAMSKLLLEANTKDELRRAAISLYTTASFLFKVVNYAMREPVAAAQQYRHLRLYGMLLNDSVRYYRRQQPWQGRAHRVLRITSSEMLKQYEKLASYPVGHRNRNFSWTGFISATAFISNEAGDDLPERLFLDLKKYGSKGKCLIFLITPSSGQCYPVDLKDMAVFGAEDRELLYPAGQQFMVTDPIENLSRQELAEELGIQRWYDPAKDEGEIVFLVRLRPVEATAAMCLDIHTDGGDIEASERVARRRFSAARQGKPFEIANSAMELGNVLHQCGKLEESAEYLQMAYGHFCEAYEAEESSEIAHSMSQCLNNIGKSQRSRGNLQLAHESYTRALELVERICGKESVKAMEIHTNLGIVFKKCGNFDDAKRSHRCALQIAEMAGSQLLPELADILVNLGNTHKDLKEFDAALECYDRALQVDHENVGGDHPKTAITLECIGFVKSEQGHYQEALRSCERALGIKEKHLGNDHRELAETLANLGNIHEGLGMKLHSAEHLEKAKVLYERTLEIDRKHNCPDDEMGIDLQNLGDVHECLGQEARRTGNGNQCAIHWGMSKDFYQQALASKERYLRKNDLPLDHPMLRNLLTSFGNLHTSLNEPNEAERCLDRARRCTPGQ